MQLLCMSGVSGQWSQLLDGDASGRFDCWRHVVGVSLRPSNDGVWLYGDLYYCSTRLVKQPENAALMLRSLRRVRSLDIRNEDSSHLSAYIRFLDLLFAFLAASSASSTTSSPSSSSTSSLPSSSSEPSAGRLPSSRVRFDHVGFVSPVSRRYQQQDISAHEVQLSAALSRCILLLPPLRSAVVNASVGPSIAALRHLCRGGLLQYLEVNARLLSDMEWAGSPEAATAPWGTASTVQSLVLYSMFSNEIDSAVNSLCVGAIGLRSLTHLFLADDNHHGHVITDALHNIAQHLGDRLTFLRLRISLPLDSAVLQFSLLESLFLKLHEDTPHIAHVAEIHSLRLLPRLSELTIIAPRWDWTPRSVGSSVVLPLLPASLTYLQIFADSRQLVVSRQSSSGTEPIEQQPTALPHSLRCLSLSLPMSEHSSRLLEMIPADCPRLTHCHVTHTSWYACSNVGDLCAEWPEKLRLLRDQLDAGIWCETVVWCDSEWKQWSSSCSTG